MTHTEELWRGHFGDRYHERPSATVESNTLCLCEPVLRCATMAAPTVLEFGAGVGDNLRAIRALIPRAQLHAVEINERACSMMPGYVTVNCMSALEYKAPFDFSLVFTKGFLIHVPPAQLPAMYDKLYESSGDLILIAEYFSRQPTALLYRGVEGALWKRDFADELMSRHPGLSLLDFGFWSRLDRLAPQDDLNWYLFEK